MLELVHQIFARQAEKIHFQKFIRQIIAALQNLTERIKFFSRRQIAEKKEKTGFFIKEAMVFFPFDKIFYIDAAVIEDTFTIDFVAIFIAFVSDDIGDACQSDENASMVFVTKPPVLLRIWETILGGSGCSFVIYHKIAPGKYSYP